MYSLIAANRRRTALLFVIILTVIAGLSAALGYFAGDWGYSFIFAGVVMLITLFIYFNSTASVLKAVGGQELDLSDPKQKLLYNVVENLSITAGMPMPKVYLIPSMELNAFASGLSPEKAVVGVTAGMLEALDKSELEGVMGHEISHIRNYDTRVSVAAYSIAVSLLVLGELMIRTRGEKNPLPIIGLVILLVGYPAVLLTRLAISRQREYLADMSSVELTRNPEGMASALEKLKGSAPRKVKASVSHMMFSGGAKGFFASIMSTHPPLDERIARVRAGFDSM
jgi:heat shock protein HtpX